MLHSECTAMRLPPLPPLHAHHFYTALLPRHCGLDPQSPIYEQYSYISTNVSPQSIKGFFFLFALRGRGLRVKPAMRSKRERGAGRGIAPSSNLSSNERC
ncbi:MAG: hypothetical protein ACRC3G_03590 [Bacteroidales bacterium]